MPSSPSSTGSNLCSQCLRLFSIFAVAPTHGAQFNEQQYRSPGQIQQAIFTGCHACQTVTEAIKRQQTTFAAAFSSAERTKWYSSYSNHQTPDGLRDKSLYIVLDGGQEGYLNKSPDTAITFQFNLEKVHDARISPTTDRPAASTSDMSVLGLASRWIGHCNSFHTSCKIRTTEDGWYPARLVEIPLTEDHRSIIRIVDTAKEAMYGPYMTLSHRWGKQKFTMLTRSSLPLMMQQGFDASMLPATFRDAVHVAQTMHIRWLWIDCLCILQGSMEDFVTQAGLMHKVYGGSYCNISATGATDNQESLFHYREPQNLFPLTLELVCDGQKDEYHLLDRDLWPRSVTDAPVDGRGWVLQESFLSPRTLHFGIHQLFWECRESQACEAFPKGFPRGMNGARDLQKGVIFQIERTSGTVDSREAGRRTWRHLLQLYSGCALTDPDDRLTAISGKAAQVQRALNDDYVAGLWKSDMVDGLSWQYSNTNVNYKVRPKQYRAPSWSWASVEPGWPDNLLFPIFLPKASTRLVGARVIPVSQKNPLGPVSYGSLTLQGRLWKCARVCVNGENSWSVNGIEYHTNVSWDDQVPAYRNETYCILLSEGYEYYDKNSVFRGGLLLQPSVEEKGVYRRVAYFSLQWEPETPFDDFYEAIPGEEHQYPCLSYDPTEKLHTFKII